MLAEYRCIIFTHGCFWHRHDCYLFRLPATRREFWLNKIDANVRRDRRDAARLAEQGWRVLVVWECALRGKHRLSDSAPDCAAGGVGLRRQRRRADRYAGDFGVGGIGLIRSVAAIITLTCARRVFYFIL
ncbi:Very short patch repair protein [Pluralibacter gergoviae]|nr:Very short patch repair protein [Pluralibacter gergoviae]